MSEIRRVPSDRPLRYAVIGAGSFCGAHIKGVIRLAKEGHSAVEVAAVADISDASFPRLRERFGLARLTTDVAAVLGDPAIDAVSICVPHDRHAELAIAAARAGKHALVEKPMACAVAEAEAMVAAAEQNGALLMVGQCERFDRQNQALKRRIDAGELGRIHSVRIDVMQNAAAFVSPGHWYLDRRRAGGGVVISVGVHRIDLVRYLVGEVRRVTAQCRTVNPMFNHGAEDLAVALLELDGGALCEFFATWSAFRVRYIEGLMLFGDKGAVHAIPEAPAQYGAVQLASTANCPPAAAGFAGQFGGYAPLPTDGSLPTEDPVTNELAHFFACCRSGTQPLTSGQDNLKTMRVIEAIYGAVVRTGIDAQ